MEEGVEEEGQRVYRRAIRVRVPTRMADVFVICSVIIIKKLHITHFGAFLGLVFVGDQ